MRSYCYYVAVFFLLTEYPSSSCHAHFANLTGVAQHWSPKSRLSNNCTNWVLEELFRSGSTSSDGAVTGEQVFTLGVVLSNPNINEQTIFDLLRGPQQQTPVYKQTQSWRRYNVVMPVGRTPVRLQMNPVYMNGHGLDGILRQLFCSPESRGTNAIMFIVDKDTSANHSGGLLANFVATVANFAGLPSMAWSSSIAEMERATNNNDYPMVLFAPSVRHQADAIFAFLQVFLPTRKVAIIVSAHSSGHQFFVEELRILADRDEEGRRYSRFEFDSHQHHMSSRFIQLVHLTNSSLENIHKELVYLRDSTDTSVLVVFADPDVTNVVMDEAHILGMTTNQYIWICGKSAYTKTAPQNYPPGMIAVTYNTSLSVQMLALKAGIRVWSESVRRLVNFKAREILMPTISCTRFIKAKWRYGSLFHRLLQRRYDKMMALHGVFKYGELNEINLMTLQMNRHWKRIGDWTTKNGLVIDNHKWLRRFDREHMGTTSIATHLRIVTLDEPPYVTYEMPQPDGSCLKTAVICKLAPTHILFKYDAIFPLFFKKWFTLNNLFSSRSSVCCTGFVVDLLRKLSQDIGFQFDLFEVADQKWGSLNKETGQWNGLIQALLNNTGDMVATSVKINTDRSSAIDFSVPFYQTGVAILVRVREGVVSPIAFLEPFSIQTWLVVFLGCVNATALFIFFFENFTKIVSSDDAVVEDYYYDRDKKNVQKTSSLFGSFWLVLSMLFNAAVKRDTPRSISGRFIVNIWAFFCVIFMSSFMANLAAFMITKEEFYDFSGLDDMRLRNPYSKNPPWKFSTIPFGATEHIIKTNFPLMYEHMRKFTKKDVDEGVHAVKEGELDAFIYDASVLSYKAGRDKNCQLRTVGKWYAPTGYAFGLPKSSKWLHSINKHILDYQVSGFLQHLEDYWLSSSCKQRFQKESQKSTELGITNLKSLFALLALSLSTCGVFLGIENFYAKKVRPEMRHSKTCRLIAPNLDKALSIKRGVRHKREIICPNPSCRYRKQLLEQLLKRSKERVQHLQYDKDEAIHDLIEGVRETILGPSPSSPSSVSSEPVPIGVKQRRVVSCDANLCCHRSEKTTV